MTTSIAASNTAKPITNLALPEHQQWIHIQ